MTYKKRVFKLNSLKYSMNLDELDKFQSIWSHSCEQIVWKNCCVKESIKVGDEIFML